MIKIYRDDTGDEIQFEGDILFTLKNPIFNEASSHSFEVTSTNNRHNKHVFDYAFLPEVRKNDVQFMITINIKNTFYLKGAINFRSITNERITYFFIGQNNFWGWATETNMRNINVDMSQAIYPMLYNAKAFDNFPFPVSYANHINANLHDTFYVNDYTAKIPMFKMNYLVQRCLETYGISIEKNDISSHADLNAMVITNENTPSYFYIVPDITLFRVTVDFSGDQYIFDTRLLTGTGSPTYDPHGYTEDELILIQELLQSNFASSSSNLDHEIEHKTDNIGIIDAYRFYLKNYKPSENGNIDVPVGYSVISLINPVVINRDDSKEFSSLANHLPDITVKEFLRKCETFGFKIFINESQSTASIRLLKNIIKQNALIDITAYAGKVKGYEKTNYDGFTLSFTDGDDDYFKESVMKFENYYNVKDPVASISLLPLTGNKANDIRLVTNIDQYYKWNVIPLTGSNNWEFFSANLKPMIVDTGKYEINIDIAPLVDQFEKLGTTIPLIGDGTDPYTFVRARMDIPLSFVVLGENLKSTMRFFFYRGDPSTPLYFDYSTANRLLRIINGVPTYSGNLESKMDGDYGFYEQLYKEWIQFVAYNYGEEERVVNWPMELLQSFDWALKYRINNMNYYVKEIMFKANSKTVEMGKSVLIPAIH